MSSVYQSKSQERMLKNFPHKNLKVKVKQNSEKNHHNIINLVQKGGGNIISSDIDTVLDTA